MYTLLEGERIKDISKFEGDYAVTDHGRVWSYKRNKWLAPCNNGLGYSTVNLWRNGKDVCRKIHRLVGEAFIKNPQNKPFVNHKNGIKSDCHYKNLEWVTARENNQHACDNGLNSHYKLSGKDKIIICKMYYQGKIRMSDIARIFELSSSGILHIIRAYGDQEGHA